MNIAYLNSNDFSFFSGAQEQLDQLIQQLQSEHYAKSEHGKNNAGQRAIVSNIDIK